MLDNQLSSMFYKFEKKFLSYTDVVSSKPKHSKFLTDIYRKLSVVTEKKTWKQLKVDK